MKQRRLASRIVAGVMGGVSIGLLLLGLWLGSFTHFEVTERLDNSLQEVAERLEFVVSTYERLDVHAGGKPTGKAPEVAWLAHAGQRTLAYQIVTLDRRVLVRSQNAPETCFDVALSNGLYDSAGFRVYVTLSLSGRYVILVGEPAFHRSEAVARAVAFSIAPLLVLFPVIWLMVRLIVRRSLRPMAVLQSEIAARGGRNLTPVRPLALPPELAVIHSAVNSLLERLTMALATERAFAANAAHELRNPIASLLAQAQLLQLGVEGTEHAESVAGLVQQARRIGRTTDKLLQFSRVSSGVAFSSGVFDLVALVSLIRMGMPERERLIFAGDVPERVMAQGDIDAAGILVRNIFENALHYSPTGSDVLIRVGIQALLTVENAYEGAEIPCFEQLTRPFVRGVSDVEGSGLGLAIVMGVARQMHAEVDFRPPTLHTAEPVRVCVQFQR
ncbi:histidine kinase dimerization/phospho-acceptor domain-containing protein [Neokomagataea anthophila]|uniref:histidine kinase n=1 Tax=Neokomagataea anthophila TaxID=2826925 RepID=A0ABS5E7G3_9PROT|nr:histidine kinase dimerization/phospho-acceptor domain-containing protein [Neokomagataea anthophila]MBR0559843.1 two-component sensor histidine kinase [Neokomagataea anthophila]